MAQLKKYLPDPVNRIKLHDLVMGATDDVIDRVQEFPMNGPLRTPQLYREQLEAYEEATAGLLRLIATGAFFSDRVEHDQLLAKCLDRLANRRVSGNGVDLLLEMQDYPLLLGLYAVALGAAAADRLDSIAGVLGSTTVTRDGQPLPAYVIAQWALRSWPGRTFCRSICGVVARHLYRTASLMFSARLYLRSFERMGGLKIYSTRSNT